MASGTSIRKKLASKSSSLQFLPQSLSNLANVKYIEHSGKRLKSAYVIDIIHNLILKYYFRKENNFCLHSSILKEKYGHLYNHYLDYLINRGIIEMSRNYLAGRNARTYMVSEKVLRGEIIRYSNTDSTLLKKYRNKVAQVEEGGISSSPIDPSVKAKLVEDLFYVDVDLTKSIFFLDHLKDRDDDIYNRNVYSVQCIDGKHIFYHFDGYGRMHTNFTILKSFIRKNCLLIDGETTHEIDIKNSQPLFLTKIIESSGTKWVKDDEFRLFSYLTKNGLYYQYIMDASGINDRRLVKEWTYKVLFGRNAYNSKADKLFSSLFPTIHNFIKLYKRERKDYKVLAYELQRAESKVLYNRIVKTIMEKIPGAKIITVHDSVIVPTSIRSEVELIFDEIMSSEFKFSEKALKELNI